MSPVVLARRFMFAGLLMMIAVSLLVSWLAVSQLQAIALMEAQARARLVAEEMADQVQLAVNVGVPVSRLVGVEELFEHRMESFPGIARAALLDPEGRVLHERRTSQRDVLAPATRIIAYAGATAAVLELQWGQPTLAALLLPWGVPLAVLIAVTTGLAAEALRFALTGVALRRERLVQASCQRIASGNLATRVPRLGRRDFDSRIPWLSEQLRHIGEQHMRVERLAQSLRQTEPDFDKRRQIDQIFSHALGHDHFPAIASTTLEKTIDSPQGEAQNSVQSRIPFPSATEMPASSRAAFLRWRGVLIGILAWGPVAALAGYHFVWVGAGALICLGLTMGIAQRMYWWEGTFSGLYGALLGGLVFGPCLSLLIQMAWAPQHFRALGGLGYAVLAVLGMAALVLPWFGSKEQDPLPLKERHAT